MMFTPVEPVQAAPPPPPALVRVAPAVEDGARWQDGISWRPERCFGARAFDACASPQDEVQSVAITGGPTGGDFTLTYSAQTTAAIAYNANAAAVLAALEALSNLAPGDVTVTGGPGPGAAWTVRFRSELGNVGQMTANGAGLTGGVAPAVNVTTTTPGYALFGPMYGVDQASLAYYLPAAFEIEDRCAARSGRPDEARMRRQVVAGSSFMAAHELWTGEHSDLNPYVIDGVPMSNGRLASSSAAVVTGTHSPAHAIGALEDAAREASLGQQVWIHVPLELLPLVRDGLVVGSGGMLTTVAGSVVVADAGYTGTAPDGDLDAGVRWMYATGPVEVRFGTPEIISILDHAENTWITTGRRMFAARFDPCVHYGVAVALPETA